VGFGGSLTHTLPKTIAISGSIVRKGRGPIRRFMALAHDGPACVSRMGVSCRTQPLTTANTSGSATGDRRNEFGRLNTGASMQAQGDCDQPKLIDEDGRGLSATETHCPWSLSSPLLLVRGRITAARGRPYLAEESPGLALGIIAVESSLPATLLHQGKHRVDRWCCDLDEPAHFLDGGDECIDL
jgi:hypothetical protein